MTTPEQKAKKAQQMKAYRQKLKEANPEAYLEKQRTQKQKIRAKNKEEKIFIVPYQEPKKSVKIILKKKAPPLPSKLPDDIDYIDENEAPPLPLSKPPTLKNITKDIKKIDENENELYIKNFNLKNLIKSKQKINEASLQKYINNIKRLYENMSNDKFEGDLTFLYAIEAVKDFIEKKYTKLSTRTDYYKSITSILKRIKTYEDLAEQYSKLMMTEKKKDDDEKGDNLLSENETKNYVEWKEILNMPTDNLNPEDALLYSLYINLPPRRLDIKYMKLIKGKYKASTLDKNFNYIIVNAKNKAMKIIYNNYKTSKVYKQFVINFKDDIKPYIMFSNIRDAVYKFLENNNIKSGDLLFPNNEGNVYVDFSRRLQHVFKPLLPKLISSNILRHSFLSYVYEKPISINTMIMLAKYMSHSPLEALSYRRFKNDTERDEFEKELNLSL